MLHQIDQLRRTGQAGGRTRPRDDAHIPLWRRITALFTLSSIVILIAVLLAMVIAVSVLLALFVLERAIAG